MHRCMGVIGCLLLLVTFLQGKVLAQNEDILAKIGDTKITITDFNRILGYFDSQKQKVLENNPQLKETVLRQLVQAMVLSDLAKKKGFDKRPEVKEQLELFENNFYANVLFKEEVAGKVTVSEDDVKLYYDNYQDEFKTPEMVRARHILVKIDTSAPEEAKKKAREKAEDILKKIKAGEDFAKLASDFSDDLNSKSKGGDLGFFSKGGIMKPFEDAISALKPGEISGIVESQFGYHILKLEEKKDSTIEPYEKVKDKIHQKLLQERTASKITEIIDKAMKDAGVEMHPELLMELNKK